MHPSPGIYKLPALALLKSIALTDREELSFPIFGCSFLDRILFVEEIKTEMSLGFCAGNLDGQVGAAPFFLKKGSTGFRKKDFHPAQL
jgi:hypothetical protein